MTDDDAYASDCFNCCFCGDHDSYYEADPPVQTSDRGFHLLDWFFLYTDFVQYISAVTAILARLAGTYTTANFIFLSVIFLLIVKMFHMSIKMSQLETRVKELVQEMALEENRRAQEEKEKRIERESGVSEHVSE